MRKYQYYDTGADGDRDAYSNNWGGQTFTPEMDHLIASVKLKLFRVGTPGTLKVSIRATSAGKPAGGDLCSGEIDADTLTIDTNGEWYEITLGDGYEVKTDTTYAIVIRATTGDTDNKVSWRADISSPTYSGGSYVSSSDSGADWSAFSGVDTMFEVWGAGAPSPTTVTWGTLLKSQISAEKIEEAINRMIQDHEDDPDSHLETGESLHSHKASEIIDHIVDSIIEDKIKDDEITAPKLKVASKVADCVVAEENGDYTSIQKALKDGRPKDVSDKESDLYGIAFNSDGTKMYVVGLNTATVYQYNLSIPWVIASATYSGNLKDVSTQDGSPNSVHFSSDGTKMYIIGWGSPTVFQYTLSSAWDVSSATYSGKSKDVSGQDSFMNSMTLSLDGTKMYTLGNTGNIVFQYTLSTAWDVSSATYSGKSKDVSGQDGSAYGIFFSSDGTKMYVAGSNNDRIFQYTLSTAWDVSSATYDNTSKDVSNEDSQPREISFNSDGTRMYIAGNSNDTVYQYALSTAWDILSAKYKINYTIFIKKGTYIINENISIPDNTTITGENKFGTILDFNNQAYSLEILGTTGVWKENIAITKLTLKNSTAMAIKGDKAKDIWITENIFDNNYRDIRFAGYIDLKVGSIYITHNFFKNSNAGDRSVYVSDEYSTYPEPVVIRSNFFYNPANIAIQISTDFDNIWGVVKDNVIIYSSKTDGTLGIANSYGITEGNYIYQANTGIETGFGTTSGNYLKDIRNKGIVGGSSESIITNNLIYTVDGGANEYGIEIAISGLIIANNMIYDANGGAIHNLSSDYNNINGNTIKYSTLGIYLGANADNNLILGNIITNYTTAIDDNGTGNVVEHNIT